MSEMRDSINKSMEVQYFTHPYNIPNKCTPDTPQRQTHPQQRYLKNTSITYTSVDNIPNTHIPIILSQDEGDI